MGFSGSFGKVNRKKSHSNSSLAENIQCDNKTIKRWLEQIENMYVIFQNLSIS